MLFDLRLGDCLDILPTLEENSVDSCVSDVPYHLTSIVKRFSGVDKQDPTRTSERLRNREDGYARLATGFAGLSWDGGDVAFRKDTWDKVYRILKPGAHVLAFAATRNYHRLATALEDAGFEIRDALVWAYGTGMPKSHDISKNIDNILGRERNKIRVDASEVRNGRVMGSGKKELETRPWIEKALEVGYHELADKNPVSDEAKRWNGWGTGLKPAVEIISLARKPISEKTIAANVLRWGTGAINIDRSRIGERWPANLLYDDSEEMLGFLGEASRFFYCAKPTRKERGDYNDHPTLKPEALLRWLVRMVTPKRGLVLDPFMGSGTTGLACANLGFNFLGIELEQRYFEIAQRRLEELTPKLDC